MSDCSDVIYFYFFVNKRFARAPNPLGNTFRHVAKVSNPSGNDFRRARKCQTLRETTFAERGNAKPFGKYFPPRGESLKPFGKRLSPCAEMSNHSGNDFRQARKCQTIREMTFAMRGNAKPFGKRLSPCAEMPNYAFFLIFSVSMCSKPSFYSIVLIFNEWSNDISLCIWIRYGGVIIPI